jgi:wobble nucleotide-excising tRNase
MIKKINKIKNLGLVFSDYSWNYNLSDYQLPEFKRFNLIYGWTGSGKTTLSKLFYVIEDGDIKNIPNLEYEIEDEGNNKYRQGESFNKKIRVFNQNYIENNLKIQEGKAKAITLILGDVNKETVEQIEIDKSELEIKNSELKKANEQLEQKKKEKNKTFTEIAKTIYVAIMGGAIRTYRKDNAEIDFLTLKNKETLSDEDLEKFSIVVKQNSKPVIDKLKQIEVETDGGENKNLTEIIGELISEAENLLEQTVESQIIERIKNNQDISAWIESGITIHEDHKSVNCEFCDQVLPKERLAELSKHFNEADKKLKQGIDNLVTKFLNVDSLVKNTEYPDKAKFYDELQEEYERDCKKFDLEKTNLLDQTKDVIELIKSKKLKTTELMECDKKIIPDQFINSLDAIINFITKHNKKTSDFESEKNNTINKLKKHFLSTIFDEVKNIEKEIKNQEIVIRELKNGNPKKPDNIGIDGLKKRITDNQAKISSTHKACEDINKGLSTFLGRDELVFEPHKTRVIDEKGNGQEIEDGYIIKRHGKVAYNLSEGEKTAVAFVYFTIYLKDQNFDLKEGIVVIDDPVSSLDSNSLFQAFAFLKNAVKDAQQIFIFTHNFEFLKLLLNWCRNVKHSSSSYYMIKNCYKDGMRCAYLDKMDKELCEYESEYHYLFKILKEFKSNETIAQAYPIPNIARKVLDTFLLFRVPCGGGMYAKLEKIKDTTLFDENKLTAIYKFVNDQSHITGSGFNPALVPETQKNVKYLLEMIEHVFPEHYQILQEAISPEVTS